MPHKNEEIKIKSDYLRGNLASALTNQISGAVGKDDQQLIKFHGIYQQDDRDERKKRRKKFLEPAYSFMIRVRAPAGELTSKQWLCLEELADEFGGASIRLTTRQAIQFHGIIKTNLRRTLQRLDAVLLDSLAACGDVNRNVMSSVFCPNANLATQFSALARKISVHLTPKTRAYHEIWLADTDGNKQRVDASAKDNEPIYGKTYLPRKFKIAITTPPCNDVDIFAQDLGFIAICEKNNIIGYNVSVGGGMGMTHGNEATFPRLADVIGFCKAEQVISIAEAVVKAQRDHGNRDNRQQARLKYTIERMGLAAFVADVEKRAGFKLAKARPFEFESNADEFVWRKVGRKWRIGIHILAGRLRSSDKLKKTLANIAREFPQTLFHLTPNQNLCLANINEDDKLQIDKKLASAGVLKKSRSSSLRLNSLACVALPTCALALAESERALPKFLRELEEILAANNLREEDINFRITGCPNGCARPYLAEIALVGRAPDKYNLYLGGANDGTRLNKLYKENLRDTEIAKILRPILKDFATNRKKVESFGDFVIRKKYVARCDSGRNFHKT